MKTQQLIIASLFVGMTVSANAQTFVVNSGPLDSSVGAVRYRNFGNSGGDDMFLGVPSLGNVGQRVATSAHTWVNNSSVAFSFNYDQANNKLTSTLGTTSLTYTNFVANVTTFKGAPAVAQDWNAMSIKLFNRQSDDHSISMSDVLFNGNSLTTNGTIVSGFNSEATFQVQGYDFKNGFTLSGLINLSGPTAWNTSQELNVINADFGYDMDAVPEPATMSILSLGVLAALRKRKGVSSKG
ncbi:hypothetical protein CCB80_05355 [Armatimonadetes bacterium Uphvl-Ar1]|nr:hypothetical protein CCB80_05355 [Armatimonadetes bacterium Uphvl-Ar1]